MFDISWADAENNLQERAAVETHESQPSPSNWA